MDYTLDTGTKMWWPTPVLRRIWPDHEEYDDDLCQIILEKESTSKGMHKSNEGGWHSDEDLLVWDSSAIAIFQSWIIQAFNQLSEFTSQGKSFDGKLELNAWANVNREGSYNTSHTHPECVWSGVYYVDVGDAPTKAHPLSGAIEFLDPRAGCEMTIAPGLPFGMRKTISPVSGEMIMFPSWIRHSVHPYFGKTPRISVAFNVRVHLSIDS